MRIKFYIETKPWYSKRYSLLGYTPRFRPPHNRKRNPIRFGRWQVRKMANGRWMAWTEGKTYRRRVYFDTFERAIQYANWRAGRSYQEYRAMLILRGAVDPH